MKHKYTTRFAAFARAIPSFEGDKQIATAALNDLANVFQGEEIRARIINNPDLLFWASNLALLDYANLNDDCLRKEDGLKIYKNFILKLVDIEHKRDDVVGAIYEAGFSLFGSNRMISFDEAVAATEPVQLVVGGYLWRIVASKLCDYIEQASMEHSPSYGDISTSFELSFDNHSIAVSKGTSRYIGDAEIITASDPRFDEYNKMLRCKGGKGKNEKGQLVYRVLGGEILPIGAGIVEKPASGLKGILAIDVTKETKVEEPVEAVVTQIDDVEIKAETTDTLNTNITSQESSVTNNTTLSPMKIKSFDELSQNWTEIKKFETAASLVTDLKEVTEASTRAMIEERLAQKSEEFAAELKTQKELAESLAKQKEATEADNKKHIEELAALRKEIQDIKAAQQAQAAEDKYNERMEALDTEFDLDQDDRALLADEVKSIPDDETFAKYMSKCKKLMAGKKKAKADFPPKKEDKPEDCPPGKEKPADKKEDKVDAAEVVASVTEVQGQEVPNTVAPTVSLREKVRNIMGESVTIGTMKASDLLKK